jgi:large subunit ribosomal protein L10e
MAKLRKWCAYRKLERPYTRWSKARKKAFVKSRPGKSVVKYDMGDVKNGFEQFPIHLTLVSKEDAQVRTNAIEASRTTGLKRLEKKLGRVRFYFRIRAVPHQAIRENPLAAGAGADRLSTGMKHSFGKIIGTASRVVKGKVLFDLYLPNGEENFGREVLKLLSKKLPVKTRIEVEYQKVVKLTKEQLETQRIAEAEITAREEAKAEADEAKAAKAEGSSEEKPSEE